MKNSPSLILGLLSSVFIAGISSGSPAGNTAAPNPDLSSAKIAETDFGRLSTDGVSAFDDIHLARIAIFEGKIEEAARFVADAQASLGKAKTDDAFFLKAESAVNAPSKPAPAPNGNRKKSAAPVAWIPIDSELVFGEAFESTPEVAPAVVTARKGLQTGDGAESLRAIKISRVDVDYSVAAAPLEQSIAEIGEARKLMTSRDYYGASQALLTAEAGVRFDEGDDVANFKDQMKTASAKGK